MPQARRQRCQHLQMEGQVRRQDVSEAKRLRSLEDENVMLKRLLADAVLDKVALKLKDLPGKKW
jgi:hypothetical protein